MHARLWTALTLALALGACDRAGPPRQAPAAEPTPAVAPPTTKAPPAGHSTDHPAPSGGAAGAVTGKVLETMDAGGYTYVRIAAAPGEVWAAVTQTKVAVGVTVTITDAMEMKDFESKTLGRTFPTILFGTLAGDVAASPHGAPKTGPAKLDPPLARADGATGRTIAEVHAQQAKLADQRVTIRGQVTKFTAAILGTNWIHLQDGTGAADQADFDLTVTTSAVVGVGDIVLVEGVVHTNRDFGAGYKYDVIVEDATATVEPR